MVLVALGIGVDGPRPVTTHLFTEKAALKLAYALLLAVSNKWRGRMDVLTERQVDKLRKEVLREAVEEESAA